MYFKVEITLGKHKEPIARYGKCKTLQAFQKLIKFVDLHKWWRRNAEKTLPWACLPQASHGMMIVETSWLKNWWGGQCVSSELEWYRKSKRSIRYIELKFSLFHQVTKKMILMSFLSHNHCQTGCFNPIYIRGVCWRGICISKP